MNHSNSRETLYGTDRQKQVMFIPRLDIYSLRAGALIVRGVNFAAGAARF
jgi:hypothetical protein